MWKKNSFIVFIIIFSINISICAQSDKVYYCEIIHKGSEGRLNHGEFFLSKEELINLIQDPSTFSFKSKYRLINFTSYYFDILEIPLPNNIKNLDDLQWNHKISLYRGNDSNPNYLYKSLVDSNYVFYIKKVDLELELLHFENDKIVTVGSGNFPFSRYNNYLLKKINHQEIFHQTELEKLGLNKFLNRTNLIESLNKFHPSLNKQFGIVEIMNNKLVPFVPDFVFPNNW